MIINAKYIYNNFGTKVHIDVTFLNGKISTVPLDPANTDYQAIQEWIAEGGVVIDNGGGK